MVTIRSQIDPRRTADSTPDSTPMTSQMTAAPIARDSVIGNACLRTDVTGCSW